MIIKIRLGFVSNSSASSFCIYGWTDETLKKTEHSDPDELKRLIQDKYGLKVMKVYPQFDDWLIGVGNYDDEFDHWYCDDEHDWEEYMADNPAEEEVNRLKEIAKDMGLPVPEIHADTWFNG